MKLKTLAKQITRKVGRLFFGKNVWLISDRGDMAGDNGEALFLFLQNKPVKAYYAISKDSPDYMRLSATGKVVPYDSFLFRFLLCVSDAYLSSYVFYMENHEETPQIFLQHGVTGSDISKYINGSSHSNFYIITSGNAEKKSFNEEQYKVRKENLWLTGLPRYDRLYNKPEKKITVSLTWRKNLLNMSKEEITNSPYFKAYQSILEDDDLITFLENHGYKLCFKMHPMMKEYDVFDRFHKKAELWDESYTDIFGKSDLLITDYSSIAFDFAYLGKPVIYYQFDEESFWSGSHSLSKGYFDYRRDGFGEVATSYEELKAILCSYVENACAGKPVFLERVERFFAYRDKNNSERVYHKVLELLKKKK